MKEMSLHLLINYDTQNDYFDGNMYDKNCVNTIATMDKTCPIKRK